MTSMFVSFVAIRLQAWLSAVAAAFLALTLVGLPVQDVRAQARALPDFTDLVEQVGPSVVNIRTTQKVSGRQQPNGLGDEEMMEFFRRFGLPTPNMPRQAPRSNRSAPETEVPRGVGSGFIFLSQTFILYLY